MVITSLVRLPVMTTTHGKVWVEVGSKDYPTLTVKDPLVARQLREYRGQRKIGFDELLPEDVAAMQAAGADPGAKAAALDRVRKGAVDPVVKAALDLKSGKPKVGPKVDPAVKEPGVEEKGDSDVPDKHAPRTRKGRKDDDHSPGDGDLSGQA